jgi:hypothetical protein
VSTLFSDEVCADRSVIVLRNSKQILEILGSEWHGVLDPGAPGGHRLEPKVIELAHKWGVTPDYLLYDQAGLGRSFGSYLSKNGFDGATGCCSAGKGGKLYLNRRTGNAFALKRRLDPNRKGCTPFCCDCIPEWPQLREELGELRAPAMEVEAGQVKEVLEEKDALAARLRRSPDLLDALLMSFTYTE